MALIATEIVNFYWAGSQYEFLTEIIEGETVYLRGALRELISGNPIPGKPVDLYWWNVDLGGSDPGSGTTATPDGVATTDQFGWFVYNVGTLSPGINRARAIFRESLV